jgi:hypothetical protein
MIVSINQPAYLPWLGYFDRIDASDLHIVLDHVQFEKNSLVNRNRIRTPSGWTWLTIPLATKGRFGGLPIRDLRSADGGRWRKKHWKTLEMNYVRAVGFLDHFDELRAIYGDEQFGNAFLPPVMRLIDYQLKVMGVRTKIVSSSALGVDGSKSALICNLCRAVGAKTYLSGPFGRDYLDLEAFEADDIDVLFHDYAPQPYTQVWPGFEAAMSALDVLFCCRAGAAASIMRSGRRISSDAAPKEMSS